MRTARGPVSEAKALSSLVAFGARDPPRGFPESRPDTKPERSLVVRAALMAATSQREKSIWDWCETATRSRSPQPRSTNQTPGCAGTRAVVVRVARPRQTVADTA